MNYKKDASTGVNLLSSQKADGVNFDKIVMTYNGTDSLKLYVNGVLSSLAQTSDSMLIGTGNLTIGAWGGQPITDPDHDNDLNGSVRNIEIYSGEATNPTAWVPGDTTSLTGVTLKFQSENGSGTDNEQGVSFNRHGNPQAYGVSPILSFNEATGFVGIGIDESSFPLQVIGEVSATGFLVTSDERLKRNIEPLMGSLNKLNQFGGKSYEKKISDAIANTTDGGTASITWESEIGFIAQEIETAFPECVKVDRRGVKYVNYTALIPVLCEALKEVDAKHQVQLNARDERYKALEARIKALEEDRQ